MRPDAKTERGLALRYSLVAGLGFATDALLLKGGMALGLGAAEARCVSLFCAMQVTFIVNGCFVFRCLERRTAGVQWLAYMATNGFGNLCNYFAFVTLVSLHWSVVSNRWFALCVASFIAWMINYAATRLVVFRRVGSAPAPAPAASAPAASAPAASAPAASAAAPSAPPASDAAPPAPAPRGGSRELSRAPGPEEPRALARTPLRP